jgi:hypothetical protein
MNYVVEVDGKPVKEVPVPLGTESGPDEVFNSGHFGISIDDQFSLEDGQILTGHVVAVDSLGFTHQYLVLHYVAGANAQREPGMGLEKITAPNGEIVFELDE